MSTDADKKKSQQSLPHGQIFRGQRWIHYKGGEYEIVTLAVKEDTGEQMVVYESVLFGSIWIRTIENWRELVDGVPRFREKAVESQ